MRSSRLSVAQWLGLANGALFVVGVAGVVAGFIALGDLTDARRAVVDRIQPAQVAAAQLDTALVNQETGVRGFALTGDEQFLEPYRRGRVAEATARAEIQRLGAALGDARAAGEVDAVFDTATAWRERFVEPMLATVRAGNDPSAADQREGKALFDAYRRTDDALRADLEARRLDGRAALSDAAGRVSLILGLFGGVLLLSLLAAAWTVRQVVVVPLRTLAARVREVARGDFEREVPGTGAREVRALATDVDDMRRQILVERDDLARSNAELEQFAYVASHDLQEPLRKVASFSQMLQRRYGGQLDERADTYIEFAVDGAKRMQDLINDLLAFSRVGRLTEDHVDVDATVLVDRALRSLSAAIEETGARIDVGELPTVRGEASLLALVMQNLIANGLKFRGDAAPHIRVAAERDGDLWRFTVADNGIGIEAEYADRIFVIFQRLHTRTEYEGTGIGLAMCRKVIEHHGGSIWLDTAVPAGATFHFTLPVIQEDQ